MATLHVRNVPDQLYETLRRCADAEGRSIGAQVVTILEESLVHLGPGRTGRLRDRLRRRGPFARFTQRARRVVVAAQDEARTLGHNYVGTEHLLLGILRLEESVAARALTTLNVGAESVRARVREMIGEGDGAPAGALPFTPRSKKVLELSLREALALGHNYIGTEHILLALVREHDGVAARVLRELRADEERVRAEVVSMLSGGIDVSDAEPELPETEYRTIELSGSPEEWSRRLNEPVAEGWELLEIVPAPEPRAVFRRRT